MSNFGLWKSLKKVPNGDPEGKIAVHYKIQSPDGNRFQIRDHDTPIYIDQVRNGLYFGLI